MVRALRWMSLPFAAVCLGAPLWSLVTEYERYAGKSPVQAQVLSARISSPRSRGSPGGYEADIRYPVGNRLAESRLEVTTYKLLKAGDTVQIFVDRKTGEAMDDGRFESLVMVGWGVVAAAFFVFAGFRYSGILLREDALARAPSR
jgi:hypothetical protein